MPLISTAQLIRDSRNANVCSTETLEKIKRNIGRTGLYPPLIVRPDPSNAEQYIILDGHHRLKVLDDLGYESVDCVVCDVSETEAQIALVTLNRLRGEDDPRKRAELLESLVQSVPQTELIALIPESQQELNDLLSLLKFDFEEMEQALQRQMEQEQATLPVPYTFVVSAPDNAIVLEALHKTGMSEKTEAFLTLCKHYLKEDANDETSSRHTA